MFILKKYFVVIIFILVLFPLITSAHPGRTDAYGCHTCRTNCPKWGLDTGEYHCHNAKVLPQPLPPVTSHSNGVTEPAPQYTKPVTKPVVKPIVKPEPKKVTKPVEKVLPKSVVTSTPVVQQKQTIVPVVKKENWWSKMKKWF